MPSLDGTVALEEVHDVAASVRQHLHLDVSRTHDRLFQKHRAVPEGRRRLIRRRSERLFKIVGSMDQSKTTTPSPRRRFHEQRKSDLVSHSDQLCCFMLARWERRGTKRWQSRRLRRGEGVHLVPGEFQHAGRRTDKGQTVFITGRGEVGRLGKKSVAGVDGIALRVTRHAHQFVDGEIGAHGLARLPYLIALISLLAVERVTVLVREHGDRGDPQLVRASKRTYRDLTSVRHQQLTNHAKLRPITSIRVQHGLRRGATASGILITATDRT